MIVGSQSGQKYFHNVNQDIDSCHPYHSVNNKAIWADSETIYISVVYIKTCLKAKDQSENLDNLQERLGTDNHDRGTSNRPKIFSQR